MDIKCSIVCFCLLLARVCGQRFSNGPSPPQLRWSYGDNELGPDNWPYLFPHQCAGRNQSPINIQPANTMYNRNLGRFHFPFDPRPGAWFEVRNTGHTIEVKTVGQFYVQGGGLPHTYKIDHFNFHWGMNQDQGSEHTIDGRAFPMEMQIVAWNVNRYDSMQEAVRYPDGLVMLSVFYQVVPFDNPELEPIVNALPFVRDPDLNRTRYLDYMNIRQLLPRRDDRYYRYQGSMTIPRCYESVTWTVYTDPRPISQRQLNIFRQSLTSTRTAEPRSSGEGRQPLVNNFRPVQPINGRTVYRSYPTLFQPV